MVWLRAEDDNARVIDALVALAVLGLRLAPEPVEPGARANTIAPGQQAVDVEPRLAARELYQARELEAALPLAEEAARLAWQEHGADHFRTIYAEEFLAHLAALNKDPGRARAIRAETDGKLARLGNPDIALKVRIVRAEEYRETADLE
jgi:NAD(P)-dependent dehydrogenase (short-subunit alcohol dehydrogenase family)